MRHVVDWYEDANRVFNDLVSAANGKKRGVEMTEVEAWIPNPHGAPTNSPKRIVVHAMGEFLELGASDLVSWDFLEKLGYSAHALVTPSGVVVRARADEHGAYHARGYNTDSLGIEFLVAGVHTYATFVDAIGARYLTDVQYRSGLAVVKDWVQKFSIPPDHVVRHSDISPGRKVDPGAGFPWDDFKRSLSDSPPATG